MNEQNEDLTSKYLKEKEERLKKKNEEEEDQLCVVNKTNLTVIKFDNNKNRLR